MGCGSTVALYQLALFSIAAVQGANTLLYRSFSFGGALRLGKVLAESAVVREAATALCLLLTMLLLLFSLVCLTNLGTVTIFQQKLMKI